DLGRFVLRAVPTAAPGMAMRGLGGVGRVVVTEDGTGIAAAVVAKLQARGMAATLGTSSQALPADASGLIVLDGLAAVSDVDAAVAVNARAFGWAKALKATCATPRLFVTVQDTGGAFGTTGQRCTATSRLIVHRDVQDKLVGMLKDRAEALVLGYGNDDDTEMGPLINQDALDKVTRYMDIAKDGGATLVTGGAAATGEGLDDGYFFQPTIFTNVDPDSRLAQEEVFGPVLAVITIDSFDEAIAAANNTPYGLSSAVYTKDVARAFRALRDIDAGITYINGPTIGAEAHMPFGGVKATGNGHREGGWEVFEFYTETKTCYIDFSGTLQRAQIDNYDD
ncbi:MAG: aldehyde dehydrogenase family protein, partial [Bacteroidota bacterium]